MFRTCGFQLSLYWWPVLNSEITWFFLPLEKRKKRVPNFPLSFSPQHKNCWILWCQICIRRRRKKKIHGRISPPEKHRHPHTRKKTQFFCTRETFFINSGCVRFFTFSPLSPEKNALEKRNFFLAGRMSYSIKRKNAFLWTKWFFVKKEETSLATPQKW